MSKNGEAFILDDRARALANYPHMRKAGGFLFVSGISSRRPDNTYEGVHIDENGKVTLNIQEQTRAVIENIRTILKSAGADLENIIDLTVFLVDMKDYNGFNLAYNEFFNIESGPTRTTVAVHQLPNPNLLIEIKATALWCSKCRITNEKRLKAIKSIKSLFEEKLKEIELQSDNKKIDYILVLPGFRIDYSGFQYSVNKFYNEEKVDINQENIINNMEMKKKILYVKRIKQTEQQRKEGFRSKLSDKEEISSVLLPMELNYNLEGKSILLLDDLTTTGRTFKIYEKYLKKLSNNNIKISKLAIAKTI
ncbi:hypothetical protein RB653_002233 [Dictyostelium firmibasis]|uniref:2-aminomuconate deaminase n=1 Tax=Dictyostelium firmibasis TaxID=79012 RepID=A0AAN7TNH8_9MYCE